MYSRSRIGRYEGQSVVAQTDTSKSVYTPPEDYADIEISGDRPPTPPVDYKSEKLPFSARATAKLEKGVSEILLNRPVSPPVDYDGAGGFQKTIHYDKDVLEQASKHKDNPAFVHHIRSHQVLAQTARRLKPLHQCQICLAMKNENGAEGDCESNFHKDGEEQQESPKSSWQSHGRPSVLDPHVFHKQHSKSNPKHRIKMIESRGAMALRVKCDRQPQRAQELNVNKGQILEVTSLKQSFCECIDSSGTKGLVPRNILEKTA